MVRDARWAGENDVTDKADVIGRVCEALASGQGAEAQAIARAEYPFEPTLSSKRRYSEAASLRMFLRDGFIDRYSGRRLVFPGTLRLLSILLPDEFPAHVNWKMSESHLMFWELFPTIDHVEPVSRGGVDAEENWVTTSMLRNQAKSSWTVDELGWRLLPIEGLDRWDGLMAWFLDYASQQPEILDNSYLSRWHRVARRLLTHG